MIEYLIIIAFCLIFLQEKSVEDQKSISKTSSESTSVSRKEVEAPKASHSLLAEVLQSDVKKEPPVNKFVAAKSILEDYSKEKEFVVCIDSTTVERWRFHVKFVAKHFQLKKLLHWEYH